MVIFIVISRLFAFSSLSIKLSDDSKRKESSSIELIQTRSAEDIQTSLSYEIKLG